MSFIKKIKSQYEMWKITKYTRRRSAMSPDFEQKDSEYYRQNYVNGVYLDVTHQASTPNVSYGGGNAVATNGNIHIMSNPMKRSKSQRIVRCSETYNMY